MRATPAEAPRVDSAGLAAFRILFGALMLVAVARYFIHGWIDAQFVEPSFFFNYEGLEWIRPLPDGWVHAQFAALGLLALCIALGLFFRLSMALFFAGFTWIHLCDKTNYLNHYYLVSLVSFLMIFMPMNASISLDARRRSKRLVHPWSLWILRFQIGLVYVFAGVAKLESDWLVLGEPLRTWLMHESDLPIVGPLLARESTAVLMSWAGMIFDLTIPFLLLWRRTRVVAYTLVVIFHLVTLTLFPIGLFPWFMIVFATIFFDSGWPRRFLPELPNAPDPEPVRAIGAIAKSALAIYVAVQLLLPFRYLLHDGDVLWTEDGFRWSWRVMLTEKVGDATFTVREPGTKRQWEIDPSSRLTSVQERMMSTQPDMIRQFARALRDDFAERGRPDVQVFARVRVSLNGRPGRWLIDPRVDLAGHEEPAEPSTRGHVGPDVRDRTSIGSGLPARLRGCLLPPPP